MNSHELPNGYTFLATSLRRYNRGAVRGYNRYWGKATDPITAIKNVVRAEGGGKGIPVAVFYGPNETLKADDDLVVRWHHKEPPTPIGLFKATSRSIKPLSKGDCGSKGIDCERWMAKQIKHIELFRHQGTSE